MCGLGWCWQSCAAKLWASPAPVWASVLSVPTYSLHCAAMWRFRPELEDCWIASHYTVTLPPSCMMTIAVITIVFPCPDIVSALGSCSISSHGQFPKYQKQEASRNVQWRWFVAVGSSWQTASIVPLWSVYLISNRCNISHQSFIFLICFIAYFRSCKSSLNFTLSNWTLFKTKFWNILEPPSV